MSYDDSTTMNNNMQLTYPTTTDGTTTTSTTEHNTRMLMLPPPSSPSPSPTTDHNNPNGIGAGSGGADSGESNYALTVTTGVNVSGTEVVKRKRGRPRKNPVDDGSMAQSGQFSFEVRNSGKRPRGRPSGSTNMKLPPAASGIPGVGFMPHVLDVNSGENVLAKLVWFSQNSTRALCILSATGTISNVTLQQASTPSGTVTYEGRFEILSLSGSFTVPESDDERSRIRGLSVSLSGPDGSVLGGNVAGRLTAASSVQVIVGSFVPANRKLSKERGSSEAEVVNDSVNPVSGSLSESSGGVLGSPVGQTHNSNNTHGMSHMLWR